MAKNPQAVLDVLEFYTLTIGRTKTGSAPGTPLSGSQPHFPSVATPTLGSGYDVKRPIQIPLHERMNARDVATKFGIPIHAPISSSSPALYKSPSVDSVENPPHLVKGPSVDGLMDIPSATPLELSFNTTLSISGSSGSTSAGPKAGSLSASPNSSVRPVPPPNRPAIVPRPVHTISQSLSASNSPVSRAFQVNRICLTLRIFVIKLDNPSTQHINRSRSSAPYTSDTTTATIPIPSKLFNTKS
jgi:hypothetical protein